MRNAIPWLPQPAVPAGGEFDAVIEARCISTPTPTPAVVARPGRSVRLGTTQRRAVSGVYRTFAVLLERRSFTCGVRRWPLPGGARHGLAGPGMTR
jgi:hypothetical protein